jgi:hypothetical protein
LGAGEEGSSKLEVADGAELALSLATVLLLLLRVFLLSRVRVDLLCLSFASEV